MGLLDRLLDKSIVFSFDRTGYRRHAKGFEPGDLDVDLAGRVCLVTGASSGLGVEVVRGLAGRGATVHMLCRNVEKGERVRDALVGEVRGPLVVDRVDLSDFASIRRFVDALDVAAIDVLVHNAGVLPAERQTTPDGLELTAATNLVGPFLLSHLLWPRLKRDARLVHVSSGGMYSEPLDVAKLLDPPAPFDGVRAYAQTKRAQVVLAELLDARSPLRVSSMHPGWADTPGVETSLPRFHTLTKPILRTPAQGADTIVWLAASPAAAEPGGRFYFDRAPRETHLSAKTRERPEERERFWVTLCELVGADPEEDFR
ncbi:MAG TPA: SDR family NAD(P)-dependent oxidoreductase [Polyangiaceae bacterium LLY-WYZ-15_(1-7)]|nr:SDR family NAD(P)-dependent oxidoreductase [Polyangiaceae bacterium LLY-WYZ-15_(1-7)]HJL04866.1 SDR family NAD(P)-dependent oxidoreductase [Polyangiaceae bacterium LLY-WYZ-15_(1-7)]HJL10319.1 SDR family NAD(P)-dependent oxidoreductase [Polyangiaceae bacterium LLY-WYZ-15_(1-7)]HJL22323.1 SDR family NAD(P)-dependent oxidoreductase [Polyangiaceae bacterium LLY-WYZ-15_(1-7)]HJL29808.1 SDR family NAD(P)-dependent oxidoreductase [Polyangiaceae bacterium LLY-WYZ-15_(1-7)]